MPKSPKGGAERTTGRSFRRIRYPASRRLAPKDAARTSKSTSVAPVERLATPLLIVSRASDLGNQRLTPLPSKGQRPVREIVRSITQRPVSGLAPFPCDNVQSTSMQPRSAEHGQRLSTPAVSHPHDYHFRRRRPHSIKWRAGHRRAQCLPRRLAH